MNRHPDLFGDVVDASGLHHLIAPFAVSRLLIAAGIPVDELTPETLLTAIPSLDSGLAVYLHGARLGRARRAIRAIAARG